MSAPADRASAGRERPEQGPEVAREQRLLLAEIHDLLTHRLTGMSLQIMAHQDDSDPAELRRSMRMLAELTDQSIHLSALMRRVHVAADPPQQHEESAAPTRLIGLREVLEGTLARLAAQGITVDVEEPGRDEAFGILAERTLARAVLAASDEVARRAVPAGRCRIWVASVVGAASLRLSCCPAGEEPAEISPSLRAIRERVRLMGGGWRCGVEADADGARVWVLAVTLRGSGGY